MTEKTVLVTYDLNKETQRPKITAEVKKSASWAQLSESSYAICTRETSSEVYQRFSKYLDSNDYFYVIPLRKPYDGYGLNEVIEWLDNNLE